MSAFVSARATELGSKMVANRSAVVRTRRERTHAQFPNKQLTRRRRPRTRIIQDALGIESDD